jgi:hypothetical protein
MPQLIVASPKQTAQEERFITHNQTFDSTLHGFFTPRILSSVIADAAAAPGPNWD